MEKGSHHSQESNEKNRVSHIGKKHSKETKQKMRGRVVWNKGKKGVQKCSIKTKEKHRQDMILRKERLGYINSPEARKKLREARLKQILPQKNTSIELKIKSFLDELHIPYKTHKAVMGITQPDFFIEPNVCIYCDGDYWHNLSIAIERDKKINEILKFAGYKVIRLWEHEIKVMQLNDLKVKLE